MACRQRCCQTAAVPDSSDSPSSTPPPVPPSAPSPVSGSGAPAVPTEAEAVPGLHAVRRRTTAVLIASQILGSLGTAMGVALSSVLAQEIGGSEAVAGLAGTAAVAGTALLSVPVAALMSARGRRPGLALAYAVGAVGAGLSVLAAAVGSFPLLLLGMVAFGASTTANLQARFAAADLAPAGNLGRAISTVVWAATIGAVLGPNIAAPAGDSVAALGIPPTAGPFLWAAVVFLAASVLVLVLLRPDPLLTARSLDPAGSQTRESRSLRAGVRVVAGSARARLAFVTISAAHTAMVAIMVMTPVDLGHHGADIELIGLVISAHIAGMYAFAPVMGRLCDRVGPFTVIALTVALMASAALLAGTADGHHGRTTAGLFLLGLGWSAGLVAGSALLTEAVPQAARAAVQGLSDLTMNTSAGAGGALAGLIVARAGYGWLNLAAALLLLPVAALALFTARPARA